MCNFVYALVVFFCRLFRYSQFKTELESTVWSTIKIISIARIISDKTSLFLITLHWCANPTEILSSRGFVDFLSLVPYSRKKPDRHAFLDWLPGILNTPPPARLLRRRKQKSLSTHIDLRLRSFHLRRILHFKPFRQATETKNTQKKINNKAMNCKAVNRNLKACKAYQFFLFAVFFTYLLICCVMRVQFRK